MKASELVFKMIEEEINLFEKSAEICREEGKKAIAGDNDDIDTYMSYLKEANTAETIALNMRELQYKVVKQLKLKEDIQNANNVGIKIVEKYDDYLDRIEQIEY